MDTNLREQMEADIALAKTMSEIGSAPDIRQLVNNLIGYLDLITQAMAEHEYKAAQLKGKISYAGVGNFRIAIGYLDLITQAMAEHEYKAAQLKGKKRTLEEFIRNGKDIAKELSISESLNRKR